MVVIGQIHERVVVDTVDWFVRKAIPNPVDWHDARYGIQQVAKVDGRAWNVEVGISTSAEDA